MLEEHLNEVKLLRCTGKDIDLQPTGYVDQYSPVI